MNQMAKDTVEDAVEMNFSTAELQRYSRQINLSQVGKEGQRRLKEARVLCIGAGGLGSPAALYLAAAGIGTLGIVDQDTVDLSNLHRQLRRVDPQLRHRSRWFRQPADALPFQRRVRLGKEAKHLRLGPPIRRTSLALCPSSGWALLPLPLPGAATAGGYSKLRRSRCSRRRAGVDRNHSGDGSDQVNYWDRRQSPRASLAC